jgi:hypothetical protein
MTELSPAAQAVLDAFRSSRTGQGCLAAALRAAASHVEDLIPDLGSAKYAQGVEASAALLQSIANELDSP